MTKLYLRALLPALALAVGCADQNLGVGPYRDLPEQPYLPIGMTRVPADSSAGGPTDLLIVSSTNMDQQFNSGKLDAYNLQALHDLVNCGVERLGEPAILPYLAWDPADGDDGSPARACISERALEEQPWKAGLMTLGAGGPLAALQIAGEDYVALPTRFDQSVTFVKVQTDGGLLPNGLSTGDCGGERVFACGRREDRDSRESREYRPFIPTSDQPSDQPVLACRDEGEDNLGLTSCSETFTLELEADDPYAIVPTATTSAEPDTNGLAIGHLRPTRDGTEGLLSVLSPTEIQRRVLGETEAAEPESCERARLDVVDKGFAPLTVGLQGLDSTAVLAVVDDLADGRPGILAATNRRVGAVLNVVGVTADTLDDAVCRSFAEDARIEDDRRAQPELSLDLGPRTFGFTHRGIAYEAPQGGTPGRLWLAVRVQEQIDSDASGLVSLAHRPSPGPNEEELEVLSTIPLGEEISTLALSPFAPPGRRWLYALDSRSDQIFVLDATEAQPTILTRIRGHYLDRRGTPDDNDDDIVRFTLATPISAVFDERNGGERRMYVTNFENSTLAVIDVTSDDPREHRLIARLGADRNTANAREGDDGFFRNDR